jgi:hypothetical protein
VFEGELLFGVQAGPNPAQAGVVSSATLGDTGACSLTAGYCRFLRQTKISLGTINFGLLGNSKLVE